MLIHILQALTDGLLMGGVYALAALGLSLIFGVMKITNFAHGAMMTMGMYIVFAISTWFGISPYISVVFAMILMFGIGYILQRYVIYRIDAAPSHNQLFLTLGIAYVLENLILAFFTPNYQTLSIGTFRSAIMVGGMTINPAKLIAFIVAWLVTGAVYLLLYWTEIGKAVRATSQNREGAKLMGVVINRINAVSFGIGALCTGIAGALLTPTLSIYPTIGETFQLKCFVIAIMGGMGNLWGALVAGLIVGTAESLAGFLFGGSWSDLVVYCVFILILLMKPTGLFERRNRRDEH